MPFESRGLLAIDRQTRRALFLDPDTFAVSQAVEVVPTRLHELLMLAPWEKAFFPCTATIWAENCRIRAIKWR